MSNEGVTVSESCNCGSIRPLTPALSPAGGEGEVFGVTHIGGKSGISLGDLARLVVNHRPRLTISRKCNIFGGHNRGRPWMIVCVCNRLNDKQVRAAILSGAGCPDSVYAKCGVERNCGRCQDEIELMLDEAQEPQNPAQAA